MIDAETLAETLAAGFEKRALVKPRAVFVFDGERYVSRDEYDALADRYASALDNLEASRDDANDLRDEKAEMAERLDALEDEASGLRNASAALARDDVSRFLNETLSPFTATRFYVISNRGGHLFVTPKSEDYVRPFEPAELADLAAKLAARLPYALIAPSFRVTAEQIGKDGISRWSVTAGVFFDDTPTAEARGGEEG